MHQTMDRSLMAAIAERHGEVLRIADRRKYRMPMILIGLALYFLASWWFFSIGTVLSRANWSIAGSYLAQWVSYEVRPEFRVGPDGTMTLNYGRHSPLGADPKPDWVYVKTETREAARPMVAESAPAAAAASAGGFMAAEAPASPAAVPSAAPAAPTRETVITHTEVTYDGATRMILDQGKVTILHRGETLEVGLANGRAEPLSTLPVWAEQKRPGEKIVLSYGLTGWAEVSADRIVVRNRFFGWANFFFDTNSPFFGMPYLDVIGLIVSGERLDPAQSNLSLAWNNICYNAEWQHLDVWTKLLQTIVMAFAGTLFACLIAFPLAFVAARNITRSFALNQVTKRFFDFLRSVDMLIWALFFTRAFGPGPLAGMSAIFFTDTGTLGKLYAEALENIDDKQREGVRSVGASPLAVQRYGVLPQVMPVFASQALYFWESNTRSATVIGAVGAGGIGLKLWEAIRTNSNWHNVAYMVVLLLIVVFIFDTISSALRSRLINRSPA